MNEHFKSIRERLEAGEIGPGSDVRVRRPSGNPPVASWPKVRVRPWWQALAVRVWRYLTGPNETADEVLSKGLAVQVNGDGTVCRDYEEAA